MSTMKGLQVIDFGDYSEVVKLNTDLPVPKITAPDEILVKVHFATLHIGDVKISNGDMGGMASLMGFKPPFTPGQDYSGTIIEVGASVTDLKVGDRVFGEVDLGSGSLSEYILVTQRAKEVYPIPDGSMSMMEAASIQVSLETTHQALTTFGKVQSGESILIIGGSTVVGLYAIQICKNVLGCRNITVISTKEELCKSLGADRVVNYKTQKWEETLKDAAFDVILDVMGGSKSWKDCRSHRVLADKGRYVTVAGDFEQDTKISCCVMCNVMCSVMCRKICSCCCGRQKYTMVNQARSKTIEDCVQLIVDGKVKPMVDDESPFALDDYMACYKKCDARTAHGKLVIQLAKDNEANANTKDEDDEKYEERP